MELLVSYGANISPKTDSLFSAIKRNEGALGATKFFLEHGVDPNKSTSKGPPLHLAAILGRVEVISCLLEHGADPSVRLFGKTAADVAEEEGNAEIASLLAV